MPRVVHFELPADDPARAVKFYQEVFGWEISTWGGPIDYWLAKTGEADEPGIDGAIMRRMEGMTTVITIGVPSIDAFTERIVAAGGEVVQPKQPIPGIGYSAYFIDTEGTMVGIFEDDPTAQAPGP